MKYLLIIFFLVPNLLFAKDWKPFFCHYWTAFTIEQDECKGYASDYKVYFTNNTFSSKEVCMANAEPIANSSEMLAQYPDGPGVEDAWIFGCDQNW